MSLIAGWPLWGWGLAGLIGGSIAGSFIATLVLRWPAGRSIAVGRSCCDDCLRPLAAVDLVPILSHLILRGRCRRCRAAIDPTHLAIEAAAAAIGVVSLLAAPGPAGVAGALFGWTLLALAVLDGKHFWLPDTLTLPLLLLGLALGRLGFDPPVTDRLIGAGSGFVVLVAVAATYERVRGRQGLGGGDAKLFAALGAWLGWAALPDVLLLASLAGLSIVALRLAWRQPVSGSDRLPLGALMAGAGWLWWLLGHGLS